MLGDAKVLCTRLAHHDIKNSHDDDAGCGEVA